MITSRRTFLRTGTLAGLSIALPALSNTAFGQYSKTSPSTQKASPVVSPPDSLSQPGQEDFARYLYTHFQIRLSKNTSFEVELCEIEVNNFKELFENFVLVFRGVHDPQLKQGTYWFEHPQLGNLQIFIVQAGAEANMRYYNAVFFRIDP